MSILDIILALVAIFFIVRGFYNGIILGLFGLAGVIIGFLAAAAYTPALSEVVARGIEDPQWCAMIAFYLIFIAILVVVSALAKALQKILLSIFKQRSDRIIGVILGIIKAVLVCTIIVITFNRYLPNHTLLEDSRLAPRLAPLTEIFQTLLPEQESLNQAKDSLEKAADDFGQMVGNSAEEAKQRIKDSLN